MKAKAAVLENKHGRKTTKDKKGNSLKRKLSWLHQLPKCKFKRNVKKSVAQAMKRPVDDSKRDWTKAEHKAYEASQEMSGKRNWIEFDHNASEAFMQMMAQNPAPTSQGLLTPTVYRITTGRPSHGAQRLHSARNIIQAQQPQQTLVKSEWLK